MAKYILKTTQTFGSKIKHWRLMQWCTTVTSKVSTKEKVSSSLHCLRRLVMKHFNTHNVWPRNISEPLTQKTKLSDNQFYMHCVVISPLCKSVTEVMFWFVMYANESIESTHCEHVHFQGLDLCVAFHFQKIIFLQLHQIWSSYCFHRDTDQLWTHTQSNKKTKCLKRILLSQKSDPPFAHLLALSHINICSC